jgi:hypothetical protein
MGNSRHVPLVQGIVGRALGRPLHRLQACAHRPPVPPCFHAPCRNAKALKRLTGSKTVEYASGATSHGRPRSPARASHQTRADLSPEPKA